MDSTLGKINNEDEHNGLTPEEIQFKQRSQMRDIMNNALETMLSYQRLNQKPGINKISEITPHLYLSNYEASLDFVNLKDYNINFILYFGTKERNQTLLNRYKSKDIETTQIRIPDPPPSDQQTPPDIRTYFDPVYNIIHDLVLKEKKILLCCDRGVSLSAVFLLYYFLKRHYILNTSGKLNALLDIKNVYSVDILKFIKDIRGCTEIHEGFLQQIIMTEMNYKNMS